MGPCPQKLTAQAALRPDSLTACWQLVKNEESGPVTRRWVLLLRCAQSGRLLVRLSLVHPEARVLVPSTEQREDAGM